MQFRLPPEYVEFLQKNGPLECFTSDEPGYIQFWPMSDLEKDNDDYETQNNAPGYFGFASDGGGEMIAFDGAGAIFKLPFIGMEPRYAIQIADSFDELVQRCELANRRAITRKY